MAEASARINRCIRGRWHGRPTCTRLTAYAKVAVQHGTAQDRDAGRGRTHLPCLTGPAQCPDRVVGTAIGNEGGVAPGLLVAHGCSRSSVGCLGTDRLACSKAVGRFQVQGDAAQPAVQAEPGGQGCRGPQLALLFPKVHRAKVLLLAAVHNVPQPHMASPVLGQDLQRPMI